MNWNDQICVLTGATGGIGEAIAQHLAEKGVRLVLNGRNEAALKELATSLPGEHDYIAADLGNDEQRTQLIETLNARDDITMLVNNAGIAGFGNISQINGTQLDHLLKINLSSPIQLIQGLLSQLKKRSAGYIINVGSTFGSIGFACFSPYCASKFGLRGFTEALHREMADTKVKVFYLAPRTTSTAINSPEVEEMNSSLGNQVDAPDVVAKALIEQLQTGQARRFIGWPEKLFVKINGAFPGIVDNALLKKLPIIKKFANQTPVEAN